MKFFTVLMFTGLLFFSLVANAGNIIGKWKEEGSGTIYVFESSKFQIIGGPPMSFPYTLSSDGKLEFSMMGHKAELLVTFPSSNNMQMKDAKKGTVKKYTKVN